ncbi:MAG: hypothetical protein HFE95_03060 [Acutalibacter sp.]|nr:hypothetical protein [Acutalibacter sp.]
MPPSEKELVMYQKATAYDLIGLIKSSAAPDKTYTPEELEELIRAYIRGLEEK